jgi:DNA-binding MarR family transcriptional regulator
MTAGRAHRLRRTRHATRVDYQTLADFRYRLRLFLRRREIAARDAGVEPQQYLLLLQVKGLEGRTPATIGALAERLQIQHHAAVQLVDRLARAGLVARRQPENDRRAVMVVLRPAGEAVLERLARHAIADLKKEGPQLAAALRRLVRRSGRRQ